MLALVNPEKVYLVVNDNDLDSMSIAQTYCRLRDVPWKTYWYFLCRRQVLYRVKHILNKSSLNHETYKERGN
ncbi:MAG: hypothetical protein ACLUKN_14405 [Bacilli bacterium]